MPPVSKWYAASTVWKVALILAALRSAPLGAQTAPPPQDEWPDDRPIARFFQNLAKDLRNLPSPPSLGTLALGGGTALAVHPADDDVRHWVGHLGPSSYTNVGRDVGSVWIEGAGAVSTYAIGKLRHNNTIAHIGSDLIRGQTLNGVMTIGLKAMVDRTRPNGGHYSLPSGHSGATFTSAAILHGHFGRKAGVPAYATAAFVAWTRIRAQQHWLSDVALGATIGTIAGHTVTRGHKPATLQVTPVVSTTGLAVYFVKK